MQSGTIDHAEIHSLFIAHLTKLDLICLQHIVHLSEARCVHEFRSLNIV